MGEGQRARLRKIVTEMTKGGEHMEGLPRHKTGFVDWSCPVSVDS